MVRAFVGDSTMTSRRRAGALLVATYASLDRGVAIIHDRPRVPDVPGRTRVLRWAPLRSERPRIGPPDVPGRRKHGNAVGALPARTVHRVARRGHRRDVAHSEAMDAVCYSASLRGACRGGRH